MRRLLLIVLLVAGVADSTLAEMGARVRGWRENPAQFVYENFQVDLDTWQVEALSQLGGPYNPRRRLAMKACTGPGKSAVLAFIGWHRLACFGENGEHPKGAAISGEGRDNLRDNLWAELAKWQARSEFLKLMFRWNKEQITATEFAADHPEAWFLSARSYAKDADTDAIGRSLSGLHSRFPFVLLDETGSMPLAVGQKATQIFTGGTVDGLIAQAGNPTDPGGLLYHSCVTERELTIVVTITADPDDPRRTPRVDIQHAREQIALYGRDNPWVKATILGEFPPAAINALFNVDEIEAAMQRHLRDDEYNWAQKRLGVDVARYGDDLTVGTPRQGLASFKPFEMRHKRNSAVSVDIADRVMAAKLRWGSEVELFDATGGWAAGAVDILRAAGLSPFDVQFADTRTNDPRFYNKRAEIYFGVAAWLPKGALCPNRRLVRELAAMTYTFKNGKFILEDKDQIKARIGFSPDYSDSLALTFGLPEMPTASMGPFLQNRQQAKAHTEFDPYRSEP